MKCEDPHLSDQQLLLSSEGELTKREEKLVRAHRDACRKCRARGKELEETIAEFVCAYRAELGGKLPPIAGQRTLLKTRLAQPSTSEPSRFRVDPGTAARERPAVSSRASPGDPGNRMALGWKERREPFAASGFNLQPSSYPRSHSK